MELKLQKFKDTLDGFKYLANVDFESLTTLFDPRLIDGLEKGLIRKFEVATEQSWKAVKSYLLQYEGIAKKHLNKP